MSPVKRAAFKKLTSAVRQGKSTAIRRTSRSAAADALIRLAQESTASAAGVVQAASIPEPRPVMAPGTDPPTPDPQPISTLEARSDAAAPSLFTPRPPVVAAPSSVHTPISAPVNTPSASTGICVGRSRGLVWISPAPGGTVSLPVPAPVLSGLPPAVQALWSALGNVGGPVPAEVTASALCLERFLLETMQASPASEATAQPRGGAAMVQASSAVRSAISEGSAMVQPRAPAATLQATRSADAATVPAQASAGGYAGFTGGSAAMGLARAGAATPQVTEQEQSTPRARHPTLGRPRGSWAKDFSELSGAGRSYRWKKTGAMRSAMAALSTVGAKTAEGLIVFTVIQCVKLLVSNVLCSPLVLRDA